MKTGLESLDTGAPEITYSGNQGPKSPQEDQRMMQEFQMAQLEEEYAKYVFEMEEQGIQPMSMQQFMEQAMAEARQGVKEGGIMRTGFQGGGRDAGAGSNFGSENFGGGNQSMQDYMTDQSNLSVGPSTISDAGAAKALANNPSLQAGVDRAAIAKAEIARFNKEKMRLEKLALDKQLQENTRKNKFNKGISTLAKAFLPLPIKVMMAVNKFANPPQTIQDYMEDETDTTTGITDPQAADYFESINNPPAPPPTGGDDTYISPTMAQIAGPTTTDLNVAEDVTGDENTFELRPDDFVSRFSIPDQFRQRAAFGGIMGLDGRRAYGLGSKLKRAFKKITKSTIGKAALAYFGANFAQGKLYGNPFTGRVTNFLTGAGAKKAMQKKILDKTKIFQTALDEDKTLSAVDKILKMQEYTKNITPTTSASKKPGLGTLAALTIPAIAGGLYTKKTEKNQPTLDEAMAQSSRGSSPFDQYGGVQGFRDMINKGNLDRSLFPFLQPTSYAADGGRIGLREGGIGDLRGALSKEMFGYDDEDEDIIKLALGGSAGLPPVTMMSEGIDSMSFPDDESTGMAQATTTLPNQMPIQKPMMDPRMMQQMMMASKMNPQMGNRMMAAMGGRMNYAEGGDEGKLLDMGGMEKDYRNEGGFVPMGEYERKDDVPARLSKNEFVFTADAVRNAGGGDIDKGAEIMENMMENLEAGGKVSKGSQGLSGAREMFATQQRLGEVL